MISGSGRSAGEGNSNPLQCSCLGSPMDRGAWQATTHGVAKSGTRLGIHTQQPYWGTTLEVVDHVHTHTAGVGLTCEPISSNSLGAGGQIQGGSGSCRLCCHVHQLVDSIIDLHHSSGKPLGRSMQGFLTQFSVLVPSPSHSCLDQIWGRQVSGKPSYKGSSGPR